MDEETKINEIFTGGQVAWEITQGIKTVIINNSFGMIFCRHSATTFIIEGNYNYH